MKTAEYSWVYGIVYGRPVAQICADWCIIANYIDVFLFYLTSRLAHAQLCEFMLIPHLVQWSTKSQWSDSHWGWGVVSSVSSAVWMMEAATWPWIFNYVSSPKTRFIPWKTCTCMQLWHDWNSIALVFGKMIRHDDAYFLGHGVCLRSNAQKEKR